MFSLLFLLAFVGRLTINFALHVSGGRLIVAWMDATVVCGEGQQPLSRHVDCLLTKANVVV